MFHKNLKKIGFVIALSICAEMIQFPQITFATSQTGENAVYEANWDSIDKHNTEPEWFKDAKFGVWFHWGPYSTAAYSNEWYAKYMYQKNEDGWGYEYSHHVEKYGDPFTEWPYHYFIDGGYDKQGNWVQFAPKLVSDGGKFDPDAWAKLFADSGAKIGGVTAEHHDGFSMWDSEINPWNAADKGPKLDLVGLLTTAYRKEGLKVMFSNHNAYNFTGFYEHAPKQSDELLKQLYGQLPFEKQEELWLGKLKEQIDKYKPDYMWNDFGNKHISEQKRLEYLSYYYNKAEEWGKEVIVSSNVNDGFNNDGYYNDSEMLQFERGGPADIRYPYWMSEDSISPSTWCYIDGIRYYSARAQINSLVDKVSKNGTLILNIAPMADGTIPQEQQDILRSIGNWLKKNGEAIYATRAWDIYGEGPTKMGGGSFHEPKEGTESDIRFTKNKDNNVLYAIGLGWPEDNNMVITSLRDGYVNSSEIKAVKLVDGGEILDWKQDYEGLHITLPEEKKDVNGVAVKIEFTDSVPQTFNDPELSIPNSTRENIDLPTSVSGCTILWQSSDEDVISNTGELLRIPDGGEDEIVVTLTATITKDGLTHIKRFNVRVISELENLVLTAEKSMNQADIDAAQRIVITLLDSAEKDALVKRIDKVQKRVDACTYIEHNGSSFLNGKVMYDSIAGDCVEVAGGGINTSVNLGTPISLIDNKFIIEQKIKFDDLDSDSYLYMFSDAGQMWAINANNGNVMGSQWQSWSTPAITPGKWYNVVFEYDGTGVTVAGEKFHTMSIIDIETDTVVSRRTIPVKLANGEGKDAISRIQYYFDGFNTQDVSAYVGDLIITEQTPLKTARNAVVKAERTNIGTDLEFAKSCVDELEEGDGKNTLLERLDLVATFVAVTDMVVKAETTRLQADYDRAFVAVSALDVSDTKNRLLARLEAIDLITPEEAAEVLVEKAEKSRKQEDVDTAQLVVVTLPQSVERVKLENRLDVVQFKIDSLIYRDYEDQQIGTGIIQGNNVSATVSNAPDNVNNKVEKIEYCESGASGWGAQITASGSSTSNFVVEQKVRFDGDIPNGAVSLYVNGNYMLWHLKSPDNGSQLCDSKWRNIVPHETTLKKGNWYKVVTRINTITDQYTLSLIDLSDNSIVVSQENLILPDGFVDEITYIHYQINGYTTNKNGYTYLDDLTLTPVTSVAEARKALVKAERSKSESDIKMAEQAINKLSDGADKSSFTLRLIKLLNPVLELRNIEFSKQGETLEVLQSGNIKVDAQVENVGIPEGKAQLMVSLYKKTGDNAQMVKCCASDLTVIKAESLETLSVEISISDISDGKYELKAFVWSGETMMKPICCAEVINN